MDIANLKRFIGLYHFCEYWQHWDEILDVTVKNHTIIWTVQEVDLDGSPNGPVRQHCTRMNLKRFSDKLFVPTHKQLRETYYKGL